jgi:hypothetical protein
LNSQFAGESQKAYWPAPLQPDAAEIQISKKQDNIK